MSGQKTFKEKVDSVLNVFLLSILFSAFFVFSFDRDKADREPIQDDNSGQVDFKEHARQAEDSARNFYRLATELRNNQGSKVTKEEASFCKKMDSEIKRIISDFNQMASGYKDRGFNQLSRSYDQINHGHKKIAIGCEQVSNWNEQGFEQMIRGYEQTAKGYEQLAKDLRAI